MPDKRSKVIVTTATKDVAGLPLASSKGWTFATRDQWLLLTRQYQRYYVG